PRPALVTSSSNLPPPAPYRCGPSSSEHQELSMSHERVTSFLISAALLLLPQAFAQTRNRTESTGLRSADLTSAVDSLRKHSDKFEDKLGDVLDHSTYDHRARESLMRWADVVEDQVDSMAKELKADNTQQNNQQFIDHFESA